MSDAFEKLITALDHSIRKGNVAEVRERLLKIRRSDIFSQQLAKVMNLCWRAGIAQTGIRYLAPTVRCLGEVVKPNAPETAEYAKCLIAIGAISEGEKILAGMDFRLNPRVLFYQAAALISQWNYPSALPLLTQYEQLTRKGSYDRLVAQANLAAALVFCGEYRMAMPLIRELLYETSLRGDKLLYGRCLEVAAQCYLMQERWDDVKRCLEFAETALTASKGVDAFLVRKWQALYRVARFRGKRNSLTGLSQLRNEATALGHWETRRHCDATEAILTKNESFLIRVYFGTPHAVFRERLLKEFGVEIKVPDYCLWQPTVRAKKTALVVDLLRDDSYGLETGQLLHRLLSALCSDFYRPIRVAALAQTLYPHEIYNPDTTPARVYEAVRRLRNYFSENKLPLGVEERNGLYALSSKNPCALIVPGDVQPPHRYDALIKKLKGLVGSKTPFTGPEAAEKLGVPYRTVLRVLSNASAMDKLKRLGSKRHTIYVFAA